MRHSEVLECTTQTLELQSTIGGHAVHAVHAGHAGHAVQPPLTGRRTPSHGRDALLHDYLVCRPLQRQRAVLGTGRQTVGPGRLPQTIAGGPAPRQAASPRQHPLEGGAELLIENTVDDGVERAVEVSEPREHAECDGRDACRAEGADDVDGEERGPAQQEHAHDDAECDGRLVVRRLLHGAVRVAHEVLLLADGLDVHAGVAVETEVDEDHDETRHVEADERRDDGVERVELEQTHEAVRARGSRGGVVGLVPAHLDGEEGYEEGKQPHGRDEGEGAPGRHPHVVVQRTADVDVAVETDGTQVEDGRRRTHHVERYPDLAEVCAEHPVAEQVVDDGERHDEDGDEGVGHGQRHDEQVTRLAQVPLRQDGDTHEEVAGDGEEDDEG